MAPKERREKNRIRNILWRKKNPEKYLQSAKKYRENHKEKIKDYKLQTKYGISINEYKLLYRKQDGKCLICGNLETATHNFTKKIQNLAVDHCHVNGKVRGLLCQDCNRGLGKFHDDILRLKKAIEYLEKHTTYD